MEASQRLNRTPHSLWRRATFGDRLPLIAIAVMVLLVGTAYGLEAARQPDIRFSWCCASQGPVYMQTGGGFIILLFGLANTGTATGVVTVNWMVNSKVIQQHSLIVPAGADLSFQLSSPWYVEVVDSSTPEIVHIQKV